MNKKITVGLVVVTVLVLVTLVVIYAPNMIDLMLRMHSIPQH